jgi:hypothetical protein
MDMVGHQNGKMTKPGLFLMVKTNGIKNGCSHDWVAKMVLVSRFCAKGDEITGVGRNPVWRFVGEIFTRNHAFKYSE